LKGLNNWLENRVKTLEEELKNSKNDFENLELIYKNSSCKCNPSVYENCESIKKKVHYLETVLASQNYVFGKFGLGFSPQSKKNGISKPYPTVTEKNRLKNRNNWLLHVFIA